MKDLEIECLNKQKQKYNCKSKFYFRYVDDTFLCIKKQEFDQVFNEYESKEKNKFLDVTIHRAHKVISTNWYQKSQSSNRVLLFTSNHTHQQKRKMVYYLANRAFLLSDKQFRDDNRRIITQILLNYKYPIEFIKVHIPN